MMAQPATLDRKHVFVGSNAQVLSVPQYRISGLYSYSNAEVVTPAVTVPSSGGGGGGGRPIALNANATWAGRLVTGGCDEGCAAYIFVEVLDAASNVTIEGFDRYNFSTLMAVDGGELPLRWGNNTSTSTSSDGATSEGAGTHLPSVVRNTTLLAGRQVRFRFGFRDATIYALVLESTGLCAAVERQH